MDRISAIRNVEDALSDFEAGEVDLATMEERVLGALRTYATEFDEGDLAAYRATGHSSVDGLVVVAAGPDAARERITGLVDGEPSFEVERLG